MKRALITFLTLRFLLQLCPVFATEEGLADGPSLDGGDLQLSTLDEQDGSEDIPAEIPFSAEIVLTGQGYVLMGSVDSLPSTAQRVRPYYSLDGVTYAPVHDEELLDWDLNHLSSTDEVKVIALYPGSMREGRRPV